MNEPNAGDRGAVLIVEDEILIAMDAERILQDLGFADVRIATTLTEAERALGDGRSVALAVVDLRIGGNSAAPLLADLRRRGVPAVITTGSMGVEGLPRDAHAFPLVAKPYSEVDLQDAARRALGASRAPSDAPHE